MELFVKNTVELFDAIKNTASLNEETVIYISEGRYEFKEKINLKGKNIKFVGVPDKTILSGSVVMRIADGEAYNSSIKCFDMKKIGIGKINPIGDGPYGDFWDAETMKPFLEDMVLGVNLYFENNPMPIVRYPKTGFIKLKDIHGETLVRDPLGNIDGCKEGYVSVEDERVFNWTKEKNAVLVGYWRFDWLLARQKLESVKDGIIKLKEPYAPGGYNKRGYFYGINIFSELTDSGEWYYDHENEKLYVIPYDNQTEFTLSVTDRIFELKECENISFENLIFEETQKTALRMYDCNNIKIKNCVIRNTGSWAIIGENCNKTTISGCLVYATGGGGIALGGGHRNTLTASDIIIENNEVHNIGLWDRVYTPGIRISGCGSVVRGNKVHDVPSNGILFHGNNHLIEKNELYNTCNEQNDCGSIYCGKDWSCRGNVIRYNHFHDMSGHSGKGCIGLYFDDGFSSAEVYGNIFVNIHHLGILIGGGRDFNVHNNMFFNCKNAILVDDRYRTWAAVNLDRMKKYLNEVPYQSEIWKKAYPELCNILEEKYEYAERVKIYDNMGVCENILGAPRYVEKSNNIII